MELWDHGALGPWGFGTMGLWDHGALDHRFLESWDHGVSGSWGSGTMGLWDHGALRFEDFYNDTLVSIEIILH